MISFWFDFVAGIGVERVIGASQDCGDHKVIAFFAFFWEDYYTMQKFVRGLVLVYYLSLLFLLRWPEPAAIFVSVSSFVIAFTIWYQTRYWRLTAAVFSLDSSH